ncbi:phosphoribosylglycinamide formyltransferase [Alterisphingorhabdus coralli]|uniref:Phosphoribosylglycinamide formyltransferase n=1 Tax=Alterisphingorhabdus coralli TaxID=3071408 RepID=A0AA97I0I9_9SPHN|nr:phosphoribosylglycinamide formyltransferase [Parasphingorhabdus sp. SCSIO 66989]WOE74250.1 phosphoribosylglycinamide formyltransferase [Parasphingorhabdus sp. SCSIO 66989]
MAKARLAIMISGVGTNMAALLYASRDPDCPYEVVLVASNNPDAQGLKLAEAEGVATFSHAHKGLSREEHDTTMHAALTEAKADYVALAGYMRILSDEFVSKWAERMVNIHPSLLPKYKGLDTHQRAIDAGDSHGGCSVHLVTPELDDGPVLDQTPVAILPDDDVHSLTERVKIAEYQLYARTLSDYIARENDPDWIQQKVDGIALSLPSTHARESHGAPGWRVGSEKSGKFFAYLSVNHHGEDRVALLVKCSGPDEMMTLIDQEPEIYHKPAYYGASGWIGYRLDRQGVDWDHVRQWLERSWRSVAPKSLTKLMDAAEEF